MGEKKQIEKQLFKDWKDNSGYEHFITDGIFDEEQWDAQSVHILFVLKEANWEDGDADLCEYLLSESSSSYWKTWNNVARWTKAILEGGDYPRYVSKQDKSYWLRKVAFLNLKKVGGDAVAEDETIREYAQNDAMFIKRQIVLYNPDIIICCGRGNGKNADILHDAVLKDNVSDWKEPVNGYNYFTYYHEKTIPVISFYHPQMRGSHEKFAKRFYEMVSLAEYMKKNVTV